MESYETLQFQPFTPSGSKIGENSRLYDPSLGMCGETPRERASQKAMKYYAGDVHLKTELRLTDLPKGIFYHDANGPSADLIDSNSSLRKGGYYEKRLNGDLPSLPISTTPFLAGGQGDTLIEDSILRSQQGKSRKTCFADTKQEIPFYERSNYIFPSDLVRNPTDNSGNLFLEGGVSTKGMVGKKYSRSGAKFSESSYQRGKKL